MTYPEANLNGQFIQSTNKKHTFPLTPSGVWQGLKLSATGTSAASPIQWSWMGFRLAVFIWSYFLLQIKIVKADHSFILLLCMWNQFPKLCIFCCSPPENLCIYAIFRTTQHLDEVSSLRYVPEILKNPLSTLNTWPPLEKKRFHSHFALPLLSGKHMPINRERDVSVCILE